MTENGNSILLSDNDYMRLSAFLASLKPRGLQQKLILYSLEYTLQKASVVAGEELPEDVVRMNCRVWLQEVHSGNRVGYYIVFPWEADPQEKRLSVLSSIGSAVLGRRIGEVVECLNSRKRSTYRIQRIEESPMGAHSGR